MAKTAIKPNLPDCFSLTAEEESILRVTKEPCKYLDDYTVHMLLTNNPYEFHSYVRDKLIRIAKGEIKIELPAKQIFSDQETLGDFRVMPCKTQHGKTCVKTVKIVGTNTVQNLVPDQITVGKAYVVDSNENFVSHIIDACLLSSARTGICAVQAIESLARSRRRITIVGSGRVGYYTAMYAACLGGVEEIFFIDLNEHRAKLCARALESKFQDIRFTSGPTFKLDDTDVLVLATTSQTPVYSKHDIKADLIISLGADIDYQHELNPDLIPGSDIFVESMDSLRYGDLKLWIEKGLIEDKDLTDLFTILKQDVVLKKDTPKIFISTGSALFDNLAIGYILKVYTGENNIN